MVETVSASFSCLVTNTESGPPALNFHLMDEGKRVRKRSCEGGGLQEKRNVRGVESRNGIGDERVCTKVRQRIVHRVSGTKKTEHARRKNQLKDSYFLIKIYLNFL